MTTNVPADSVDGEQPGDMNELIRFLFKRAVYHNGRFLSDADATDFVTEAREAIAHHTQQAVEAAKGSKTREEPMDELVELLDALERIVANAAPDGTQDDGDFIGYYVLQTGAIHKAIPLLQRYHRVAQPMGDVKDNVRYQAAIDRAMR